MYTQRVGYGYDIHQLVIGKALVLGGVKIEHEKGLLGHSDADVLIHAVIDAILGAAAFGDIGVFFSDSNKKYENANSLTLLGEIVKLIKEKRFEISNIDSVIAVSSPKLCKFRGKMEENIALVCGVEKNKVNVKFKTSNGLGLIGEGSAVCAHAVVLLS
jgi:2-C-methyl-D-erythritol 2,4-cyclodiphosphate synthase